MRGVSDSRPSHSLGGHAVFTGANKEAPGETSLDGKSDKTPDASACRRGGQIEGGEFGGRISKDSQKTKQQTNTRQLSPARKEYKNCIQKCVLRVTILLSICSIRAMSTLSPEPVVSQCEGQGWCCECWGWGAKPPSPPADIHG